MRRSRFHFAVRSARREQGKHRGRPGGPAHGRRVLASGWFPRGRLARQRATYTRANGVRHIFAALDLATGQMSTGKVYLVCDNSGSHGKAEVRAWCAANDIELVYTPINASWPDITPPGNRMITACPQARYVKAILVRSLVQTLHRFSDG
jgi:hypothetical protein